MADHDTDAYYKISRAFVDRQPSGNLSLATTFSTTSRCTGWRAPAPRRLGPTGEAYGPDAPTAGGRASAAADDPVRLHDVPGRDLADAAQLVLEASYPNVIYFHKVDKGGHFAAWEEPELFVGAASGVPTTALMGA